MDAATRTLRQQASYPAFENGYKHVCLSMWSGDASYKLVHLKHTENFSLAEPGYRFHFTGFSLPGLDVNLAGKSMTHQLDQTLIDHGDRTDTLLNSNSIRLCSLSSVSKTRLPEFKKSTQK